MTTDSIILIADSGSTKTDWLALKGGAVLMRMNTSGINPVFQSEKEIETLIETELLPQLGTNEIEELHFYGAGCGSSRPIETVSKAIGRHLQVKGTSEVSTDLMAAARALCGRQQGIACILGTGSNSCFYNGKDIASRVPSLGFILGDEGSGAYLGKRLVSDVLKNQLTPALKEAFMQYTGLTEADTIDRVYRRPFPNRFLAGLSPFIAAHLNEPALHHLVRNGFTSFFRRNIMQYDYRHHAVHCTGSIAFHYKQILTEAACELGITIGTVVQSPMEGLAAYHRHFP